MSDNVYGFMVFGEYGLVPGFRHVLSLVPLGYGYRHVVVVHFARFSCGWVCRHVGLNVTL